MNFPMRLKAFCGAESNFPNTELAKRRMKSPSDWVEKMSM